MCTREGGEMRSFSSLFSTWKAGEGGGGVEIWSWKDQKLTDFSTTSVECETK